VFIQNLIAGKPVSPEELEEQLKLNMDDNVMINYGFSFPAYVTSQNDQVGVQLALVMLDVKMSLLNTYNIVDFLQRLAFRDACGESPIKLPEGVQDLATLYFRLSAWMNLGWSFQTTMVHMEENDFWEYTEFKIAQKVVKDIRAVRVGAREVLLMKLPTEATENSP